VISHPPAPILPRNDWHLQHPSGKQVVLKRNMTVTVQSNHALPFTFLDLSLCQKIYGEIITMIIIIFIT